MRYKNLRPQHLKFFLFLILFCWFSLSIHAKTSAPAFFSYEELTALYEQEALSQELEGKLYNLLHTPFVENPQAEKIPVSFTRSARLGEFLRVAHWNIERGLEYEAIEAAFSSEEHFLSLLDAEKFPFGSDARREILEQARALRLADVIVLNEVDWGMKRTDYRHITADLAARLGMNYAFGVQFVELSPVYLSRELKKEKDTDEEFADIVRVDPERYKGFHGIAILSRFPLENVRLVPFKHQPYDWYSSEKRGASLLEKGKRELADKVFLEKTLREVRRGGRATLLADITDKKFPSGRITIAATHLENRTKSANRVRQLEELLAHVRDIKNPVILAGDMNTSTEDLTPTSIRRELMKRYGNPRYWIKKGIQYALGFGVVEDVAMSALTFGRKYGDPTVRHIPFFSPNTDANFFKTLEKFRFADGGAFDFRGEPERSANGRGKKLANSNERGQKGFVTTYQVKRPIYIIGKYKLDWIFVKPFNLKNPSDKKGSYQFAPHFGRTLVAINEVAEDRISDHRPMIVDLPLGEPSFEN